MGKYCISKQKRACDKLHGNGKAANFVAKKR